MAPPPRRLARLRSLSSARASVFRPTTRERGRPCSSRQRTRQTGPLARWILSTLIVRAPCGVVGCPGGVGVHEGAEAARGCGTPNTGRGPRRCDRAGGRLALGGDPGVEVLSGDPHTGAELDRRAPSEIARRTAVSDSLHAAAMSLIVSSTSPAGAAAVRATGTRAATRNDVGLAEVEKVCVTVIGWAVLVFFHPQVTTLRWRPPICSRLSFCNGRW